MSGLTLAEIQAHLARLTYRPGWSVFAWSHEFEGVWVTIRADVEDSYAPGSRVPLGINSPLPPIPDAAYLERWVAWRLGITELHEMREWLKRDGAPIFDPHVDGVNDPPEPVRVCESGCGCRYGTEDPDRRDCACDGPCAMAGPDVWGCAPDLGGCGGDCPTCPKLAEVSS